MRKVKNFKYLNVPPKETSYSKRETDSSPWEPYWRQSVDIRYLVH